MTFLLFIQQYKLNTKKTCILLCVGEMVKELLGKALANQELLFFQFILQIP